MGVLNQAVVDKASESYEVVYTQGYSGVSPQWQELAIEAPSGGAGNNYIWLGEIPQMKEWIGPRQKRDLAVHDYYLKNKKYELTIGVPAEAWKDDTLGVYSPLMMSMGAQAARHPDKLIFQLLPDGFTAKGYDGVEFFSTAHPNGPSGGTWSNHGTASLSAASFEAAMTSMMSLRDKHGEPLGLQNFTLVVGPALRTTAMKILKAERVDGGNTNINMNTAELIVSPRLAGHNTKWFLLANLDGLKPFIFQIREKPEFKAKDSLDDDNMFWDDEAIYGVQGRWNAGYGLPQLAYGSLGDNS